MGLEKINEIRKRNGISVDELSELSGIPKGTLSKITAGITKNPNIDTVKAIARALECTLDDFDDTPNLHSISLSERDHIKKYRALDEHGQKNVDLILDSEYERCIVRDPLVLHDVKSNPEVPMGFRAIPIPDVETRAAHVPPDHPQPTEEQQKKLASLADKVRKKHEGK